MNMKKIISGVMATAIVASMASISAFAAIVPATFDVFDSDGKTVKGFDNTTNGTTSISGDQVLPNSEFYVFLGLVGADAKTGPGVPSAFGTFTHGVTPAVYDGQILLSDLVDKDNWKFDSDKDDNAKMVKSISLYTEKSIDGSGRSNWIKFVLNDSTTTSEMKLTGEITFKARNTKISGLKAGQSAGGTAGTVSAWDNGDLITIPYTIWMNNTEKKGSDDSADTGDRIVFKPQANEVNTFVWGDDYAALYFNANDDPNKFYARLDTKNDSNIYAEYGDPVGADLWFYNFVSNAQVPSTSQAVLTLGIPWDEDNDIVPNPADCFIYEKDADGVLTDVTDRFTYSEDNDGTTGIAGWTIKTRTLGSYILSDTELDIVNYDDTNEPTTDAPTTDTPVKDIPNTGSSDMVNVAVVAAVVSLAAAGAVAFRKVK